MTEHVFVLQWSHMYGDKEILGIYRNIQRAEVALRVQHKNLEQKMIVTEIEDHRFAYGPNSEWDMEVVIKDLL